ncbi:MAG: V-type ATPase subunit [Candidatus Pacebacteria bacterium]|nr:V-type ATPase subunit [Candidatus Paceibacterota bacterium]
MYEFATGVINVWEKRLLSRLDQERMVKSPDRASAFMVLFDTDLSELISPNAKKDIEEVFSQDLNGLKKKLSGILDDNGFLITFLFLKFDAFNLKSALKAQFFQTEEKKFKPFDFSVEPYANIESALPFSLSKKFQNGFLNNGKCANAWVLKMMEQTTELLSGLRSKEINSRLIEQIVDRVYFNVKSEMANKAVYLKEFVKLEIDVANLRSFLAKESHSYFLEEGNLDKKETEKMLKLKEGETEQGIKKFLETLQLSFLLESLKGDDSPMLLEKKLEGFISERIIAKEKEKGSGIEKVLAFFQKRMNSYSNIRLILFAKENGLELDEIEKALLPIV